jgi:hypothetical protein
MQANIVHYHVHYESNDLLSTNSYVLYRIRCSDKDRQWQVSRRYSDFVRLHRSLKTKYKINTRLPPKMIIMKYKRLSQRKKGLQIYLNYILSDTEIVRDELVSQFLNKPNEEERCDVYDFLKASYDEYDDLIEDSTELDLVRFERFMASTYVPRHDLDLLQQYQGSSDIKNRCSVLMEILSTEISYVRHTTLLWNMYYLPMTGNTDSYKTNDMDIPGLPLSISCNLVPPNLDTIMTVHAAVLTKLHQRFDPFTGNQDKTTLFMMNIGDLFQEIAPFLSVYISYLTNYDTCVAQIRKHKTKYPQFDQWLNQRKKLSDSNGFDIGACLITPVQRLPRYLLLLQTLVKYTPTDHPDYYSIEKAIRMISDRVQNNNDMVKSEFFKKRAQKIAKRLHFEYSPDRKLIKEGKTIINEQRHYIYLFHDVIILENEKRSNKKAPVFLMRPMNAVSIFLSESITIWWQDESIEMHFENDREMVSWMHDMEDCIDMTKGLSIEELNVPEISSSCSLRYFLYATEEKLM